ncbi:hypothetical protein ACVCH0_20600 [Burkholderia glumae]
MKIPFSYRTARAGVVGHGVDRQLWRGIYVAEQAVKRFMAYVGSRSYAIYLIHVPMYRITRELWFRMAAAGTPIDGHYGARFPMIGASHSLSKYSTTFSIKNCQSNMASDLPKYERRIERTFNCH